MNPNIFLSPADYIPYSIFGGLCFVIYIIALWKIFKKAGDRGWKAIIPFYNYYTQIKLTWRVRYFWLMFVCFFGAIISYSIFIGNYNPRVPLGLVPGICSVATLVFVVALIVLYILSYYRLAKAYGHGAGWTVGLFFLNPLFIMMLGFGKSQYKGNVYMKDIQG